MCRRRGQLHCVALWASLDKKCLRNALGDSELLMGENSIYGAVFRFGPNCIGVARLFWLM
jgi:hypothetical protein